jgi:hypothetical protein
MSDQKTDQKQVIVQARDHTERLNAAICDVSIAHYSYWAWHYADRIEDPEVRAQVQAELEKIARQKG